MHQSQGEGAWRWGLREVTGFKRGHEGGASVMGLVSLSAQEEPQVILSPLRGDPVGRRRPGGALGDTQGPRAPGRSPRTVT